MGLSVIAVENNRDREGALKFIEDNSLTYHLLENEEDNDVVQETFKVTSFPTSFLIDREGKILFMHIGFSEGDEVELEKEIVKLLES